MKAIELFGGAGGLGIGSSLAGFQHEAVVEWNKDACRTIRFNQMAGVPVVQGWPLHECDVRAFDYSPYQSGIDLIAGGPPCQPFSLGGKHGAFRDDRDMFPEMARAVRELKPRAFIVENVKGLLRQSFASYFNYIILRLSFPEIVQRPNETWERHLSRLEEHHTSCHREEGLHYRVVYRLLNAANHGVPQKRERVVIVGFRSDQNEGWSFPESTHSESRLLWDQWGSGAYWERHRVSRKGRPTPTPEVSKRVDRMRSEGPPTEDAWKTVRDAIHDLPNPSNKIKMTGATNHVLNPGARIYPGHTGSPLDNPAKTLKAGGHGVPGGENMLAMSDGSVRYFTVRESARLQTFPDEYTFTGSWGESMRQLGNAVPVLLARDLAMSVRKHLEITSKGIEASA